MNFDLAKDSSGRGGNSFDSVAYIRRDRRHTGGNDAKTQPATGHSRAGQDKAEQKQGMIWQGGAKAGHVMAGQEQGMSWQGRAEAGRVMAGQGRAEAERTHVLCCIDGPGSSDSSLHEAAGYEAWPVPPPRAIHIQCPLPLLPPG